MAFFSLKNYYKEDSGIVECGSRVEGCVGLKDYDEDTELFSLSSDTSAATRDHLDAAAMEINDAIDKVLSKLEKQQPKPPGTTGFDIVVTREGFKLAYCKRARKVLVYKTWHERGFFSKIVSWLAKPAYFRRER